MAHELMLRLSVRLREIADKIADDLPLARGMAKDDPALARSALTRLQLAADTTVLRARMGTLPIEVDQFPFIVGRKTQSAEKAPNRIPDLVLDDRQPLRLSRQHFMISRIPSGFIVRDLNSALLGLPSIENRLDLSSTLTSRN